MDCNNGTVTDTQTGLIWLKNANCFGMLDYPGAVSAASELQSGQCGLTDGSARGAWRLPTPAEWLGILKVSCYPSPGAPAIPDEAGTGCYATGTPWATGVESFAYWSSTTAAGSPGFASLADLVGGYTVTDDKTYQYFVWPVRVGP